MEETKTVTPGPIKLELSRGTYYWCSCGNCGNQPFADESLGEDSSCRPLAFSIIEKRLRSYCCCKKTATPPFCDGTHKTLSVRIEHEK